MSYKRLGTTSVAAMRAALLTAGRSPLEIVEDIDIEEPRANEVLIKVSNCGICHSDTTVQDSGHSVPTILGHEASGVVEMLGSGVTHLAVGDHVVLTPLAPCGHCAACARHQATECPEALSGGLRTMPVSLMARCRPAWASVQHRPGRKGRNCGGHGPRRYRPSPYGGDWGLELSPSSRAVREPTTPSMPVARVG